MTVPLADPLPQFQTHSSIRFQHILRIHIMTSEPSLCDAHAEHHDPHLQNRLCYVTIRRPISRCHAPTDQLSMRIRLQVRLFLKGSFVPRNQTPHCKPSPGGTIVDFESSRSFTPPQQPSHQSGGPETRNIFNTAWHAALLQDLCYACDGDRSVSVVRELAHEVVPQQFFPVPRKLRNRCRAHLVLARGHARRKQFLKGNGSSFLEETSAPQRLYLFSRHSNTG